MIVRIMGEGQYDLAETELDRLNELDDEIEQAVDADDQSLFTQRLAALHEAVRKAGTPVPDDVLTPSDVVLPPPDASLAEVRDLFEAEGLIPG